MKICKETGQKTIAKDAQRGNLIKFYNKNNLQVWGLVLEIYKEHKLVSYFDFDRNLLGNLSEDTPITLYPNAKITPGEEFQP